VRDYRKNSRFSPFVMGSDGLPRLHNPNHIMTAPPKANAADFLVVDALTLKRRGKDGKLYEVEGTDFFNHGPPCGPDLLDIGAHRLQRAVLEDAVRVLRSGGNTALTNRLDFAYDLWWVRGARPSEPGFSLKDICASLGLNYWEMRERLEALAAAAPKGGYKRKPRPKRSKIAMVVAA